MNFDAAIVAHSEWKRKLKSYLLNPDESLKSGEVAAHNKCPLGQWIEGEGRKQHGSMPEFAKLKTVHAHFHQTAGELVRKADSGQKVESEVALGSDSEFCKATTSVISAIAELRKKV